MRLMKDQWFSKSDRTRHLPTMSSAFGTSCSPPVGLLPSATRFNRRLQLSFGVNHRVLHRIQLRSFGAVNLQHLPVLVFLVPSNQIVSRTTPKKIIPNIHLGQCKRKHSLFTGFWHPVSKPQLLIGLHDLQSISKPVPQPWSRGKILSKLYLIMSEAECTQIVMTRNSSCRVKAKQRSERWFSPESNVRTITRSLQTTLNCQ